LSESCFNCKKTPNLIKKTVSLLCVKTKSGAHKKLTFYFQMWKYFCSHLHSSLISMKKSYNIDHCSYVSHGGTVVNLSTHNPGNEGSNAAAGTGREKKWQKMIKALTPVHFLAEIKPFYSFSLRVFENFSK
jgi:hypothetical protein